MREKEARGMTRNELVRRLRAIRATVRRAIRGSGEPPYQDWSIWTPEAGMEYDPRPLPPLEAGQERIGLVDEGETA